MSSMDRPHPEHRGADSHPDEALASLIGVSTMRFGPNFLEEALGDLVGTLELGDLLAEDDDVGIPGEFLGKWRPGWPRGIGEVPWVSRRRALPPDLRSEGLSASQYTSFWMSETSGKGLASANSAERSASARASWRRRLLDLRLVEDLLRPAGGSGRPGSDPWSYGTLRSRSSPGRCCPGRRPNGPGSGRCAPRRPTACTWCAPAPGSPRSSRGPRRGRGRRRRPTPSRSPRRALPARPRRSGPGSCPLRYPLFSMAKTTGRSQRAARL